MYDLDTVYAFVNARVPVIRCSGMQGIGLERHGELVAGVLYEGFNGHHIWMHVAALAGRRWMTRQYLYACFAYPFVQCGVRRVRGSVNASNVEAQRFDEHLGFTREAVLKGAASDGGDVIIYVMEKKDCRYA